MRQTTFDLCRKQPLKPLELIGYCFFCGKPIPATEYTESYTYFQGELCHLACLPKTSIDEFKGRVNEFLVAEQLVNRGYEVYFPGFCETHVDILARKGSRYLRLQVRTAYLSHNTFKVNLSVGNDMHRWKNKQNDIEVLIIVCPSDHILRFFCIPALLVKDHRALTLSLSSGSRYAEFLDNWDLLDEIKTDIVYVVGEEESKFIQRVPLVYRAILKRQRKLIGGITVGEDSEILVQNLVKATSLPFSPWSEEVFIQLFIRKLIHTTLHELIHQFEPNMLGLPESRDDREIERISWRLMN